MPLRPYQSSLLSRVRAAFASGCRRVCMSLPTGGGKTAIFVQMAMSSQARGNRVWIVVPRVELLRQAASMLAGSGVECGFIAAGYPTEDRAVMVASSDTLLYRLDATEHGPDFVIIDECHLHYRRQREIQSRFPDSKIVGVTASPERLDGRGLSDLYDVLVEGPGIRELTEQGYLAPVTYYAPPLPELETVHRKGWEYNADELDALLQTKKVYGSAVDHYAKHAEGRSCLVFCRSVKAAELVAAEFRAAGYHFEAVSSKTEKNRRHELVDRLRSGTLTGLVTCEIATYGLDVPRVSCLIMLRPTLSKALQVQMIGRGLRTFPGKRDCVVLDHVGLLQEHGHPYAQHAWRFRGTEKNQRAPGQDLRLRLCPETYLYCERASCEGCSLNTRKAKSRAAEIVDGWLALAEPPVAPSGDLSVEVCNRYAGAIARARASTTDANVREAVRLGKMDGRQPLYTAHRIGMSKKVLESIERVCGYASGWAWLQMKRRSHA